MGRFIRGRVEKQRRRNVKSARSEDPLKPLLRFKGYERVAKDLEQPRLAFAAGAAEGIDRRAYTDIDDTAYFQHPPPARARQATGNSVGPKIDVADRRFR